MLILSVTSLVGVNRLDTMRIGHIYLCVAVEYVYFDDVVGEETR